MIRSHGAFLSLVPIYDGQALSNKPAFNFSDADFRHLATRPLYKNNEEEVPLHSVISVGYTLAAYMGTNGHALSSNLQFVIVLAIPSDD
jgi:hypothetical protein